MARPKRLPPKIYTFQVETFSGGNEGFSKYSIEAQYFMFLDGGYLAFIKDDKVIATFFSWRVVQRIGDVTI